MDSLGSDLGNIASESSSEEPKQSFSKIVSPIGRTGLSVYQLEIRLFIQSSSKLLERYSLTFETNIDSLRIIDLKQFTGFSFFTDTGIIPCTEISSPICRYINNVDFQNCYLLLRKRDGIESAIIFDDEGHFKLELLSQLPTQLLLKHTNGEAVDFQSLLPPAVFAIDCEPDIPIVSYPIVELAYSFSQIREQIFRNNEPIMFQNVFQISTISLQVRAPMIKVSSKSKSILSIHQECILTLPDQPNSQTFSTLCEALYHCCRYLHNSYSEELVVSIAQNFFDSNRYISHSMYTCFTLLCTQMVQPAIPKGFSMQAIQVPTLTQTTFEDLLNNLKSLTIQQQTPIPQQLEMHFSQKEEDDDDHDEDYSDDSDSDEEPEKVKKKKRSRI